MITPQQAPIAEKIPVLINTCEGFIGNRLLRRVREVADFLLLDGAEIDQIDQAMTNFGYAMGVLGNDPKYKNPFNSTDRAFVTDWDPPLAKNIGRVHCGIKGSVNTNPIMCYCRWGSGANDYDTVLVQNP